MITFSPLNKQEKEFWLPKLFDLLYDNMRLIAPSGLEYGQEKQRWLASVSSALEKSPRQIILCFVNQDLAGYLQYYTREKLLMVEEVQLKKAYHRTMVFYRLCKYLMEILPADIADIEAYADKRNLYSQRMMRKLGMEQIGEGDHTPFVHFRGDASGMLKFFR